MLRLATDANFNGRVHKGLLRRAPDLDIVRVEDVGLRTAADPDILAWTASENRILLTHDRDTMPGFAYERQIALGIKRLRRRHAAGHPEEDARVRGGRRM